MPLDISGVPLYLISITGLAGISMLLSIFSIFHNIDLLANLLIFLLAIISLISFKRELLNYIIDQKNKITDFSPEVNSAHRYTEKTGINFYVKLFNYLIPGIAFLVILMETASQVKIYDTGLYHAQAIRWINQFGVVAGLGNLHQRFAFNNQSFLLEALFNFRFLNLQPFHTLNGYLTLLFTLTVLYYIRKEKQQSLKYLAFSFLLIIPLFFYKKFISSASPDVHVALINILIFMIYIRQSKHNLNVDFWAILMLSLFLITVKLSSVPIAFLSLYYIFKTIKYIKWKAFLLIIGLGALFLFPYFIRNIYISGYLIYPFSKIDLFNVDWKIPKEFVEQMTVILKGWARTKEWSIDKPLAVWFPLWYGNLTIANKIALYISLLGPLFFALLRFATKFKTIITEKETVLYLISLVYTLFWLFSDPELRFIFNVQVFVIVLMLISLYNLFNHKIAALRSEFEASLYKIRKLVWNGWKILILIFLLFSLSQSIKEKHMVQNLLLQVPYPTVKTADIKINNAIIKTPPDNQLCWDNCIPCSIIQGTIGIDPFIELRGKGLEEGFRARKK